MIQFQKDKITIRDSELSDIQFMKDRMRKQEIDEVWASDHLNPEQALLRSYESSTGKMTFLYDGEIAGMFGVVPESLLSDKAIVWLLTTDSIDKMKMSFLRLSKKFIRIILGRYGMLYNYVDARNEKCLAWLNWCGARIYPPEAYGADKMAFHYFELGGR